MLRELETAGIEIGACQVTPEELGALVRLVDEGKINGKQGKDVLTEMCATGKTAASIISERGLVQVSDASAIDPLIDEIIVANPQQLANYRAGKEALFGFFVGQVMKASKGKANPQVVNERLQQKLKVTSDE